MEFLSTPSARRATSSDNLDIVDVGEDFYPRPPRGGRQVTLSTPSLAKQFLSTPSARRATGPLLQGRPAFRISIHALREEGDR